MVEHCNLAESPADSLTVPLMVRESALEKLTLAGVRACVEGNGAD